MSKFNFSFRRGDRRSFRNIAHGLIPAATIAPRPAVPRTPPPRSPNPSPERPRSALAAAILSSSLTGRTVAIPPPRARSYSESDCSRSDSHPDFEPFASTALYTRDRWSESVTGRPRLASPSRSEDEGDEDEEALSDEGHVYQSLETAQRAPVVDPLYALPVKTGSSQLEVEDETEDSAFDIVSPLQTEEEIEVQEVPAKTSPYPRQPRPRSRRSMPSPDLTEERTDVTTRSGKDASGRLNKRTPSKRSSAGGSEGGAEAFRQTVEEQGELVMELKEQTEALERRCSEQTLMIRRLEHELHHQGSSRDRANPAGESGELVSLRQQAQELVDENDGLKMTVHRLSAELSRYQMRFRPLAKDEMMKTSGLPMKGPAPPWLLDMKYLSPLLLAYEDRLGEKDALLKSCEGELKRLKAQAEEVVQENQKLHEQLGKTSAISQKEWRQLQDQARLVLNENQVLIEQLELQHTKAKETSSRHSQEVSKLAKQLMLVEAEKQALEVEVAEARPELQALEACLQQTRSALHSAVSQEEHGSVTGQLQRQLKEEARTRSREVEELGARVSALQEERKSLQLNKSSLTAQMKSMEEELERSRQANRKAQRRIGVLKQQVEDSIERELTAHHYLASIVTLAEKTTQERDQLIHMASSLEKDKQGVLARIIEGTVRLGKLQEKVKVFRRQAASSVGGLGRRLRQQEEEFAGRAEGFRTRIQQLQGQLSASRAELEHALRREREVENELEVVWEAATRESQLIREAMRSSSGRTEGSPSPRPLLLSPPRQDAGDLSPCARPLGTAAPTYASPRQNSALPLPRPRRGPAFESDSDQPRNPSSDESERNGMDFYS